MTLLIRQILNHIIGIKLKTVYYSYFAPVEFYGNHYMLFQQPEPLLQLIAKARNKNNKYENYIDCPAFQNFVKNTFVVNNPLDMSVLINDQGVFPTTQNSTELASFWLNKDSSRNLCVVNYHLNYIFFSEDIEISTMPAYMHNTDFQTKLTYIPGSFNIGKWFRPVEGAFELKGKDAVLDIRDGDPLYYIKFHTDEKINFVRFNMTQHLHQLTSGCMNYKKLKLHSSLKFLYNIFHKSLASRSILKEIRNNIV